MKKNKLFRVIGQFHIDFEKDVRAKTEAEAIRKAKERVLKRRKIKATDFDKSNYNCWELS